ncbi:MAG: alpha-L-rhamnosidase-related protein [Saccharofermentanales bacterium]
MKTIWGSNLQSGKNCTLSFVLSKNIADAADLTLDIVAINVYRLFINGKLAGYGPARACHGYVRKDSYDLSQYDSNGALIIVAEVFGSNVNSYYITNEPPFFGAEVKSGENVIYSTEKMDFKAYRMTDRVAKVQRYSFQRPFAECYTMAKSRSEFYNGDFSMFPEIDFEFVKCNNIIGRRAPYPRLESIRCDNIVERGQVTLDPDLPKWNDRSFYTSEIFLGFDKSELEVCLSDEASAFSYEMDELRETDDAGTIAGGGYALYDFGRTITGFISAKLKADQDSTVYIIWDEIDWTEAKKEGQKEKNICFYRNSCCNVIKYTIKAGEYSLLSFEPTSARYAKVIITSGSVEISEFAMVTYENPDIYKLEFDSDDSKLNAIVTAARNTLSQNAVDVLTDCPSRERAGWLCDAYFSAKAEKLMSGGNDVEKSLLEDYIMAPQLKELPEGMLPMCYPSDHIDGNYIPNWPLWFVVELEDYLKRTGDRLLIDQSKDKIYKLIECYGKFLNEDDLLENLEGWVFVEWSKCNDPEFIKGVNYPSNMMFFRMLEIAGELYDDKAIIKRAEELKAKIIEQSFNSEFFEENRVREDGRLVLKSHTTETCQYYAFFCQVASKEAYPDLYKTMITKFGPFRDYDKVYPEVFKSNAFIGNYLRLEILMKYGLKEQILDECKEFFYFMAVRTGTLWEHSSAYGSLDHGFASVAANYIIGCTTGLDEIDFINKTVKISKPLLQYKVAVSIPTPDGFIKINTTTGKADIKIPENYKIIGR